LKRIALSAGIFVTLAIGASAPVPAQQAASTAPAATEPAAAATMPAGSADLNRINVTGYVGDGDLPMELPAVLWKFKSDTALTNSVVADGNVYFADETGQVFSLKAEDGSQVWRHQHSKRISAQPSLDKDQLYFGSETGITAIRRDTGELVWDYQTGNGAGETTPISAGNRVFASGYDGIAYAFDRANGNVLWQHDFATDAPPDPPGFAGSKARMNGIVARPNGSACDGELFIQSIFDQSRVIALDCATGQQRWEFRANGWISPAPTIVNDHVYVVSQDTFLYCLDRNTGKQLWKFKSPSWLASRVAVHDGIIFLPVNRGRLIQISEKTGQKIQSFQPPDIAGRRSNVSSFPIVTDDACYFATGNNGELFAIGIEKSDLLWKLSPGVDGSELFTDPATDGQRIFVTSRQGSNQQGEHAIIAVGPKP
jgi:outer membrane protein assembly factor BamB